MSSNRKVSFAAAGVAMGIAAFSAAVQPVQADPFEFVSERGEFVELVEGRTLRYPGVRLQVTRDGRIHGSGLGVDVSGQWNWQGNYFCRDLYWGDREIGYNCQAVLRDGETLRFVSDQGKGRSADFRLR